MKLFKDFGRLKRCDNGTAAVEFAMIIPVYLALVLSILEIGWISTKMAMLDYATSNAAKFIYIGAASTGSPTKDQIEQYICDKAIVFGNCKDNILIEATTISDFNSFPNTNAQCKDSANPHIKPTVSYNTGGSSEIVYMRICVSTDLFTPYLGYGLALPKTAQGRYQIVAAVAFVNEPF